VTARSLRRRLEQRFARGIVGLPADVRRWLSGPRVELDGQLLDPDVALILRLSALANNRAIHHEPPERARRLYARLPSTFDAPAPSLGVVRDFELPGPASRIRARLYAPKSDAPLPIVVYLHGGGFVIGDLDTHDVPCRLLAELSQSAVVSVDYRLAPEACFPAAVEDSLAAFSWVSEHAAELGGDPARLAIAGDSAGGALATVVSALCRDSARRMPDFQLLFYPTTDAAGTTRSHALFGRGFMLESETRAWFHGHYVAGADPADPRISPLRGKLGGLPPAYVQLAGFDILRDEGRAYAERLREAGVEVTISVRESLIHGYLHLTGGVPEAKQALEDAARALKRALCPAPASS